MNFNETEQFSVDVTGDNSGQKYYGTFDCLKRLTHGRQIARDRLIREILGPNPQDASTRARNQAEIVAQIQICLVSAPDWLKNARFGLELIDDNVIAEISDRIDEIQVKAIKEIREAGNKAKVVLEEKTSA